MHNKTICLVSVLAVLGAGSAHAATEPASLNNCEEAVASNAAAFIADKERAIRTCLDAVSKLVIANQNGDVSGATPTCVTQFRKIYDGRNAGKSLPEELSAGIAKACDPTSNTVLTHTVGDVLGTPTTLSESLEVADNLAEWCTAFGGNGTVVSVADWTSCVTTAAECAVDTAISTQYPRALEWLAEVKVAMQTANATYSSTTDPNKITDAIKGLDAVRTAIDGPDNDGNPSPSCGQGGQLLTCQADLTACDSGLAACTGTMNTCNAGTAAAADVLSGKTFSGSAGLGVIGTMANNGAVTLTPGTADRPIAAGYHNGSGKCVGDANLVTGNIKSGAMIFGVSGGVIQASGNAAAGDVLSGKTFSNVSGAVTGAMTNNGAVNITPGASAQTIPAGYHNGSGSVAGDANLVAGNIKNGVSIFGVTGTLGSKLPQSGQTTSYGPGSDGNVQAGATLSYTDNTDGTITDQNTGLMWEKKDDSGGLHDKNNTYTWGMTSSPYTMNGTMVTTFLAQLNNRCAGDGTTDCTAGGDAACVGIGTGNLAGKCGFASHRDWRIPNAKELQSIINYEIRYPGPTVDPKFHQAATCTGCTDVTLAACSCTASYGYWSSTTFAYYLDFAWIVLFNDGTVGFDSKSYPYSVRAVRGGL